MDSVADSVVDSVEDFVRESIEVVIWDSVWDSTYAYIGSLFPEIKKWKGVEHEKGVYPFQSAVGLWNKGFVASFKGSTWRLHSGENAKIVYEKKIQL